MSKTFISFRLDTEDFISPASNDALLAVLQLFERYGIRITVPIVGEKLRFLHRLGRHDVLRKLREHAVGYHSNTHSLHPTIAEELADLDWQQGVERFEARERQGYLDVANWLGCVPVCYTQPGANWVPQSLTVLRRWKIPLYYGESWNSYIRTGSEPVVYGGCLYWAGHAAVPKPFLNGLPGNLDEAVRDVAERVEMGDTFINVVFHPTELVHDEFWDAYNFGVGRQPSPVDWQAPPLRSETAIRASVSALDEYLDRLTRRRDTAFVASDELVNMYLTDGARELSAPEIVALAARVEASISDLVLPSGTTLSPAELFGLFCRLLATRANNDCWPPSLRVEHFDGPVEREFVGTTVVATEMDACPDVGRRLSCQDEAIGVNQVHAPIETQEYLLHHFLEQNVRVEKQLAKGWLPATVEFYGRPLSIESYYVLCARVVEYLWATDAGQGVKPAWMRWLREAEGARLARSDELRNIDELPWRWPVFRPGFRAPRLWHLARQQIWTLKEAVKRR